MLRITKILIVTLFIFLSIPIYAKSNINSNKSVNSIIKSLQQEVSNLQVEAQNISKQNSKEQQPSFVMYNNIVVRDNPNEDQYIS
ncbi:hypothetical protein [Francisella sp. 19X1-34]|uniref:hypothetical protein n=1 Tax=Francisella sp. 19X1-34 TaxID=3087177 RepID=UPI002E33BCC3|nr:hypothetical protein [Francisella sp. 19X1-34]MED7789624.1 hypothetical protein [Francisella sp. 19X1-34]